MKKIITTFSALMLLQCAGTTYATSLQNGFSGHYGGSFSGTGYDLVNVVSDGEIGSMAMTLQLTANGVDMAVGTYVLDFFFNNGIVATSIVNQQGKLECDIVGFQSKSRGFLNCEFEDNLGSAELKFVIVDSQPLTEDNSSHPHHVNNLLLSGIAEVKFPEGFTSNVIGTGQLNSQFK